MTEKAAKPARAKSGLQEQLPASFEAAVLELESLVQTMDAPNAGLDRLLQDYKRGALLVKFCKDRLTQVKQEIQDIDAELQPNPIQEPR